MSDRYEVVPELVTAIAEVNGSSPHELGFSLYEYIAPGAIETLVDSETDGWTLAFEVPDHTVEIRGTGEILIDDELVRNLSGSGVETHG